MSKCGICLKHDECDKCAKCDVGICGNCRHRTKYDKDVLYYDKDLIYHASVLSICSFCMPKCESKFIYHTLVMYKYCHKCERSLFYGCLKNDKDCIERKLLPHYKARPIIEEIYYITGIAQIIFDYYYKPRRYYTAEI